MVCNSLLGVAVVTFECFFNSAGVCFTWLIYFSAMLWLNLFECIASPNQQTLRALKYLTYWNKNGVYFLSCLLLFFCEWCEPRSHIILSWWSMIVLVSVVLRRTLFGLIYQNNDHRLLIPTDNSQFTWVWWWLQLRLPKGQSLPPQTFLLRTTLTIIHQWLLLFCLNLRGV